MTTLFDMPREAGERADKDWRDDAWDLYQRQLNSGWRCAVLRRVAFSRWRGSLLWIYPRMPSQFWRERILDAMYPDDLVIQFLRS